MASNFQKESQRRKITYIIAIIGLFTLSLFWRGTIPLPLSGNKQPLALLNDYTIKNQSSKLELSEQEIGESDLVGSAMSVSLSGARGLTVSVLWRAAIEAQKKNDFQTFETYARLVTKLQPNFRVPWLFQSWNLAYNVSVENERLNDMYFFIARGIELLAEGERLNTKSPDMRHQIGFYYQNKFGVSDKVRTLRSLMQLSCIPPTERNDAIFKDESGNIKMKEFEEFCRKNPQLVRRLREQLDCRKPEQVVQFLRDNSKVLTRFKKDSGELEEPFNQFPILPKQFDRGPDEYHGNSANFDDRFDAFLAARGWYTYAQEYLPPPKKDQQGNPLASDRDYLEGNDRFKYRIPKSPALILFRSAPARAQSYLAERLQKEGWFDEKTTWKPDENRDPSSYWFKRNETSNEIELTATDHSQVQWEKAFELWETYGKENGMLLTQSREEALSKLASYVEDNSPALSVPREYIANFGKTYEQVEAKKALTSMATNLRITNTKKFVWEAQAEKQAKTIESRKLFNDAEVLQSQGSYDRALPIYFKAMSAWRQVLTDNPIFHRAEQASVGEELYYDNFIKIADLQMKELDRTGNKIRLNDSVDLMSGLLGAMPAREALNDITRVFAEDEVLVKITELDTRVQQRIADSTSAIDAAISPMVLQLDNLKRSSPLKSAIGRNIVNTEFSWLKEFKEYSNINEPWVSPYQVESIRQKNNLIRKLPVDQNAAANAESKPE